MAHLPPSPSLPRHHSVLRQQLDFKLDISHNVSVPPLSEPNMILISTVAVALNPCDWKMPARFPCAFATCGCDFVGKVVRIGAGVTRELKIGDRVFGAVHGSNPAQPESGTFAQYIAASADFVFVLPDNMPWEKAAALGGIGVSTIGVALFYSLKPPGTIERPATKRCYVLVSGGASASGTMAIQCLRLAGLVPIATCSKQSSELVLGFGAEKVFDYNEPSCAMEIRAYTKHSLKYAMDCIATTSTVKLCYTAMGRLGGRYTALEVPPPVKGLRKSIQSDRVLGMTILGKEVALGEDYDCPADPECYAFGLKWYQSVQKLIEENKLRPHPAVVKQGGLEGILRGLEDLKTGKNQGVRYTYLI